MSRGFGGTLGVGSTDAITTRCTSNGTGQRSYSMWFKRNGDGGGGAGRLWEKRTAGAQVDVCQATSVTLEFDRNRSGGVAAWKTTAAPSTGVWHHLVITYDASSTSNAPIFYVDGIVAASSQVAAPVGTVNTNTDPYVIGNRTNDNARNWDGLLSGFTIWDNILLSPSEVMAIYNGASPMQIQPSNLILYVPMDGVSNPEQDLINGNCSVITGTKVGQSSQPNQSPVFDCGFSHESSLFIAPSMISQTFFYRMIGGM